MAGLDFPLSNASPVPSRKPAHDSGPNRYALPSFVRLFHPLLSSGFNRRFPCPLLILLIFLFNLPRASARTVAATGGAGARPSASRVRQCRLSHRRLPAHDPGLLHVSPVAVARAVSSVSSPPGEAGRLDCGVRPSRPPQVVLRRPAPNSQRA